MKKLFFTALSLAAFAVTEARDIVVKPGGYAIEQALQPFSS